MNGMGNIKVVLIGVVFLFCSCSKDGTVEKDNIDKEEEPDKTEQKEEPIIDWQKSYGGTNDDRAYSVQETKDGGYILAGSSFSRDGDLKGNYTDPNGPPKSGWVVKLSPNGTIQWNKSYGGSAENIIYAIQQTSDGGYIAVGSTNAKDGYREDDFPNHWVLKLNSTGAIQWQKAFGWSGHDRAQSVQQTADGGYIIAGYAYMPSIGLGLPKGDFDYCVTKLNANGDYEWLKAYGGSGYDKAFSVQQAKDGGYIVAGSSNSKDGDVSYNNGDVDYWIVKLKKSGDIEWEKSIGGKGNDEVHCIRSTKEGGYIIGGSSNTHSVVTLTDKGKVVWTKAMEWSWVRSVKQIPDGSYILAGNSADNFSLAKIGINGASIWQKTFTEISGVVVQSLDLTGDGGYLLGGNIGNLPNYWVAKISPKKN